MKKKTIKNIEIRYDENHDDEIDYITNVIINNYDLILPILSEKKVISLVPTNEEDVIYISNFDETFYVIANNIFNNESNKALIENSDFLSASYIEILIRKNANNQSALVQPNSNISDEMLYSLIAYAYFIKTATFDDFVNYLKDKKDIDKILNWLQTEIRFDGYNLLLRTAVDYLKQNDFDYLDNISDIVNMMLTQAINNILKPEPEKGEKLPSITIEELDCLFNEFLKFINAPESWNQKYDELKSSGRISFEKQTNDLNTSMCYWDDNDSLRILVSTDDTISCFLSLVHEFIHYISMYDSEAVIQTSISEFPSIFFEKISAHFLKNKGYKEDIIEELERFRNENNIEIYMEISSLFNDISAFIKGGPISRDKKVFFWENNFRIIQETREKLAKLMEENGEQFDISFLEPPKIDIPRKIDKECDFLIDSFIQNGLLVINGYQYLLDTYLAENVLKKTENDSTVITRMINVTNNLSNMKLQDILIEFDMQDIFSELKVFNDTKRKKMNKM